MYGKINSKTNQMENAIHISDSPEMGKKRLKSGFLKRN
ncbi:MAG: hypothetical protein ABIH28_00300 [archaeon]